MRDSYPNRLLDEHIDLPDRGVVLDRFRRLVIHREDVTADFVTGVGHGSVPQEQAPAEPAAEPAPEAAVQEPGDVAPDPDPEDAAAEPAGGEGWSEDKWPDNSQLEGASPEPEVERTPDEVPTLVDMRFAHLPEVVEDGGLGSEFPTVLEMPAIKSPIRADYEVPTPSEVSTEPTMDAVTGGDADGKRVSETAWFMAAQSPEALAQGEGEPGDFDEQAKMTSRYESHEELPNEVRRGFSLEVDD